MQQRAQRPGRKTIQRVYKANFNRVRARGQRLRHPGRPTIGGVKHGAVAADPAFIRTDKANAGVKSACIMTLANPASSTIGSLIHTALGANHPAGGSADEVNSYKITEERDRLRAPGHSAINGLPNGTESAGIAHVLIDQIDVVKCTGRIGA